MFDNIKMTTNSGCISYSDLYEMGYMSSKNKRILLCEKLNISYCNGKQLLKRLNMFGISMEEIRKYDS
jgi:ribonuclease M5